MLSHDEAYEIFESLRAVRDMVCVGIVSDVDLKAARIKVSIDDGIQSDFLPPLASRATGGDLSLWLPEIGEQVLILAPAGEINQGVILGSIPPLNVSPETQNDFRRYSDGTTIEYNKVDHVLAVSVGQGGTLKIDVKDGAVSITSKSVSVTASQEIAMSAPKVSIAASDMVTVTGKVSVNGETTITKSLDVLSAIKAPVVAASSSLSAPSIAVGGISLSSHTHSYVAEGGATVQTGVPT